LGGPREDRKKGAEAVKTRAMVAEGEKIGKKGSFPKGRSKGAVPSHFGGGGRRE